MSLRREALIMLSSEFGLPTSVAWGKGAKQRAADGRTIQLAGKVVDTVVNTASGRGFYASPPLDYTYKQVKREVVGSFGILFWLLWCWRIYSWVKFLHKHLVPTPAK